MPETFSFNVITGKLDLVGTSASSSSALSVPRMTTAQRGALSPTGGDVVFDTDLNAYFGYNGSSWVEL